MAATHIASGFLALSGLVLAVSCGSPQVASDPRTSEGAQDSADRALRELFPEIEGPVTRDAIERALAPPPAGVQAETLAAIERGDLDGAKRLLDVLVAEQHRLRAEGLLASGDARAALAVLDRAVGLAPDSDSVRALRAEAALRVGIEDRERELVDASLADFLRAAHGSGGAIAWLGASRAALWLGDRDAALEHARTGVRALESETPQGGTPPVAPARTLAEASLAAYEAARESKAIAEVTGGDLDAIDAAGRRMSETFDESCLALETRIGQAPADPWAWERLAWIHESRGEPIAGQRVAWNGLALLPQNEALHARLSSSSLALGGIEMLDSTYALFRGKHAAVALSEWHPAVAAFDAAVERFAAGEDARALFESAGSGFARCRALEEGYSQPCLSYEVVCRLGVGWCHYRAGELELAHQAFLSMEDLFAGGLAWELQGKLLSGVQGLHYVGSAYAKRIDGRDPNTLESIDDVARAGKVYDFLHEYQPSDVNWANNAGFFNRDAAVALEFKGSTLGKQGRIDEANALLARAREGMEKSYRAYVDASRLAPEDVRIQNDTGLILTYYLQRELELAERYLQTAARLGEAQVPELARRAHEPKLDASEHEARTNELETVEIALGDAYQNLGVLYLEQRQDPVRAKAWFDKSLATGPDPRVEVKGPGGYLEQCDRALAGTYSPPSRWATPFPRVPAR
jgi:tetratricopeptide (TPR) repeat protein